MWTAPSFTVPIEFLEKLREYRSKPWVCLCEDLEDLLQDYGYPWFVAEMMDHFSEYCRENIKKYSKCGYC